MAKKGRDKRRAEWTLTDEAFEDIQECFKTTAALVATVDTNSNTWRKISDDDFVKKSVAKDIAHGFLEFLEKFKKGSIALDSAKYHDKPIAAAIEKYIDADLSVDDILERKKD